MLSLPQAQRLAQVIFFITCDVSANTRQQAHDRCTEAGLACHFWTGTEIDHPVKRHPDILDEFFAAGRVSTRATRLPSVEQVVTHHVALTAETLGDESRQ